MIQLAFLSEISESYGLRLCFRGDAVILCAPKSGAFIEISKDEYDTDSKKGKTIIEYTVRFSTQHRHFDSLDQAEAYIRMILSDEVLPIEFFDSGGPRFGGEIRRDDLEGISAGRLAQMFGYTTDYLSPFEFEVHSWSGQNDVKRIKVSDISNAL